MNALLDLVNTTDCIHSRFLFSKSGTYLNQSTQYLFSTSTGKTSAGNRDLMYFLMFGWLGIVHWAISTAWIPLWFYKIWISCISLDTWLVHYCCIHFPVVNLSAPLLCNMFSVLNSNGILWGLAFEKYLYFKSS